MLLVTGIWNPNTQRGVYDTGRVKGQITTSSATTILSGPNEGGTRIVGDGSVIYNYSAVDTEFFVHVKATGETLGNSTKMFGTTLPAGETLTLAPIFLKGGDTLHLEAAANSRLNYYLNYFTEA